MSSEHIVELNDITKSWGHFTALDSVSLAVRRGEILTLLGPSGCGKSTLMRIIAGFESQTSGGLQINGKSMTGVPPERRPVNMVFQKYALFPHLDVFDNIAFSLRLKRKSDDEIRKSVGEMLDLVQLGDFKNRWIGEISGGQAQRVALARALINQPEVLLLDEPLAALDLKIRHHMLSELKRIHTETGTTFVYVTHDQDEAMILSDRVVLMNKGKIEQIGTPDEMYDDPKSLFCAKFFGETNLLDGMVVSSGEQLVIDTEIGEIWARPFPGVAIGDKVHVSIRPEAVSLSNLPMAQSDNVYRGLLSDVMFIGSRIVYTVKLSDGSHFKCQQPRKAHSDMLSVGDEVMVGWPSGAATVLQQ